MVAGVPRGAGSRGAAMEVEICCPALLEVEVRDRGRGSWSWSKLVVVVEARGRGRRSRSWSRSWSRSRSRSAVLPVERHRSVADDRPLLGVDRLLVVLEPAVAPLGEHAQKRVNGAKAAHAA